MSINYKLLYEKITERKPKDNNQLQLFIKFITEMSKNNNSNPLYYNLDTLSEYAKVFNKKDKLHEILN